MGTSGIQGRLWSERAGDWARGAGADCAASVRACIAGSWQRRRHDAARCGLRLGDVLPAGGAVRRAGGGSRCRPGHGRAGQPARAGPRVSGRRNGRSALPERLLPPSCLHQRSRVRSRSGQCPVRNQARGTARWPCSGRRYGPARGMRSGRLSGRPRCAIALPPPGAPGPFALSESRGLGAAVRRAGLVPVTVDNLDTFWHYPDDTTVLRALLSSGPAVIAIQYSGEARVKAACAAAITPCRTQAGAYRLRNRFRCWTTRAP